ncbi:hypothetical protein SELMODRAFT_447093 [Selaginella moellendorffii]|uniref:Glutathione S-transferase 3, mitochondrial n=2 Tax=Selaginella moellendorffii TaxID=88036 RepID=D8SWM9_SELML|nr:hypothetical protein SELMODRAFT_447093 [Selaginella moellendorffii]
MACSVSPLCGAARKPPRNGIGIGICSSRAARLRARAAFPLPAEFGFVALTAASSAVLTQWQAVQVGIQRRKVGLKYPQMYEDAEKSVFNCYQRAHQNTLESYPAFLALLLVSGLGYPITASVFGMVWVIGRVVYSLGYYTGDPNNRFRGIWNAFGLLGLLVTSIVFGSSQVAAIFFPRVS